MKRNPSVRTATAAQPSLNSIPTDNPAAFLVWKTRTVRCGSRANPETWTFYETTCKGHLFHAGLLPHGLEADHPEPPPSRWTRANWQLLAQFEPAGHMEFMSSLPGCRTKEEALQLAEERIASFIRQKRQRYD